MMILTKSFFKTRTQRTYHRVMPTKDADRIVDNDAPQEAK